MTVWVKAVLPGMTETFSCWTMFPAAWSHSPGRGDVVGEGAIPALDERDAPVLLPVGADAVGDRLPPLQAARREVVAGRGRAEERGLQDPGKRRVGGLVRPHDGA